MTAEIAVMNKSAIALAADSKVTITGVRGSKTYDTVNKLFTLSKSHPVGIMIYGNADFMEYPWETLIKMFREERGWDNRPLIQDWADDFVEFISGVGDIRKTNKEANLRHLVRSWYGGILDEAEATALAEGSTYASPEFIEILKEILADKLIDVARSGHWSTDAYDKRFIKKYGKIVDKITADMFDSFGNKELSEQADIFISMALFAKMDSPQGSGVVIAGFGEDEYFPTLVQYQTDGYVGDDLKIYRVNELDIRRDMSGCIQAFAQGDMVQRFMDGVDHELGELIFNAVHETLADSWATM